MNQEKPNKWGYRLIKYHYSGLDFLEIHEVHYKDNGEIGVHIPANIPCGETIEELEEGIELLKFAFERPILDSETLKEIE